MTRHWIQICAVMALLTSAAEHAAALQPGPSGPLALQVEALGLDLDAEAVKGAIARELSLDLEAAGAPELSVALRVVSGGELTVTLVDDQGQAVSRSVAAPARADEVPEVAALLVGNLARDEASGLLARLQQPTPAASESSELPAGGVPAEPREPTAELPLDGVNLSLFHPVTLRRDAEARRFALEFGLFYSRIGALSGVGIEAAGVLGAVGDVSGLVIGSVGYHHGGRGEGVRIGGLFGVGGGDLDGVSLAGLVAIDGGAVSGAQVAGAVNVASGDVDGAQLGGALNVAGPVRGAQLAVVNVASGDVDGAQVGGALNLAERLRGLQISLINVGGDVSGAQIGLLNVARDVDGVQLGVVNVAREVDGVSLGVVPYSSRGRVQAVTWYNSSLPFNVGVRFHTGAIYVMPTFGYDPRGDEQLVGSIDGDYAPGLSLGYRLELGRAHLDLDVNSTNQSRASEYRENDLDLRYRLLAGVELTPWLGLFAGGGLRHHIETQRSENDSVDPELSLGLQLL